MFGVQKKMLGKNVLSIAVLLGCASTANAGKVTFVGEGHAYHPVWSIDGNYVAFEVNRYAGDIDLFFAKVDGITPAKAQKVSLPAAGGFGGSGQVVVNPTWHPSGGAVFEGSIQGGDYRLYYAQPGGAQASEFVDKGTAGGNLTFPSSSSDGTLMLFVSSETGNGDIRVWNTGTGKVEQLTSSPESEMFPMFSASGDKILFTRKHEQTEDVFQMARSGGTATLLVGGAGDQSRPIYGAAGEVVYFTSERGGGEWDVGVRAASGAKKTLAKNVRLPLRARPALSPDKKWVALVHDDPTKSSNIVLKKLDGSASVTIPTKFTACGEPALVKQGDKTLLSFTALPSNDSDWRFLYVLDISGKI